MAEVPRNQETTTFEKPNYANARGKAASLANKNKSSYDNPDANPGHVEESSASGLETMIGGWASDVDRTIIVNPIAESNSQGPVTEPHGIKRV